MSNEKALALTSGSSNVEFYRASTDAATLCRDIVVNTATKIQGRKYVQVEGWQAIAVAHGCTASARDVERIDGGVRAIGEVRRMSDGAVIAEAEGFVGEDEPTWYGGVNQYGKTLPKRADYAIRAMAQTRAISRACRSAFAHVVVMMNAGLSTTPAEEVPDGGFSNVVDADFTPVNQEAPAEQQETDEAFADRHTSAILALTNPAACDAYYQAYNAEIKRRLPAEIGGPIFSKLKQRRDALAAKANDNPFAEAS